MRTIRKRTTFLFGTTFVVAFTFFLSTISGEAAVSFRPATTYAVGSGPTGLALADLNGDGKADLVSANYGSSTVSVLLGNGDGTFQAAKDFPAGNSAWTLRIAVGDFNGDGIADVAVLIPTDGTSPTEIRILMGKGDGTLQAPIVTTLSAQETIVAVADVNGDKKADVLANLSDANGPAGIEVLFGNGDGTFQSPKAVVTAPAQILFAVADFNRDGKADLVVSLGTLIQIMLGNGDGTFSMAGSASISNGYNASSATTADLNGDGIPDLIVGSLGPVHRCGIFNCQSAQTSVFLSTDRGDLQGEQVVGTYIPAAVGDFDGDGKTDLAIRVPGIIPALRSLRIYPGNGDGTFGQPIALHDAGSVAAFADLNGDQLTDLVLLNFAANQVSVMLNSTPAFRMSASQTTLMLTSGGSVTDDISLTTVNGFSSAIQLSCEVSGPAPAPTCSVSPQGIPAGANPQPITLTLTAPAQSQLTPLLRSPGKRSFYALGFVLAFFGFIPGVKGLDCPSVRWLLGIVLGTSLLATIACGSSGPRVVPQNQYSVQVIAKSDTLTRTLQVSLTAP